VRPLPRASCDLPAFDAGNFVDLVQQADYNKYYDTIGIKDGKAMAQYLEFSLQSVRAASREGRNFLALFSVPDVQAARELLHV
jgi:hypothetical protein